MTPQPILLVVLSWCLAASAWAAPGSELSEPGALIAARKYTQALKALEALASRSGNDLETTLAITEQQALALAESKKPTEARAAFQRLLSLAPARPAPAGKSAAQAHAEARKWLELNPPLAFSAAPAEVAPGTVKRLRVQIDSDTLKLSRKVQFSTRTPPSSRWEVLAVAVIDGHAEVRVEGPAVEWFASLLGERDAEVARLGSAASPVIERAPAEAVPPKAVAAPARPEARAADAVVFRVAPIQVVVLRTQALGGAEQAALVGEEIARALPASAFKVTTSAQLETVLGIERQKQLLGCGEDSASCTAELADALGADVVVNSTLARTSDGLRCSVVFLSGRDSSSLERVSVDGATDGALFQQLFAEVSEAGARLFAAQRPGARLEPGKPGVRRYAVAPGIAALALGGAAGAMFAVTADSARALQSRNAQFNDAQEVAARASSGRTTQTLAWVFAGTAVAALVTAGLMFTVGAPTEPKVELAPVATANGGALIVSGVFP